MDMAHFMYWQQQHGPKTQRPRRKQVLKLSITDGSVLIEEDDAQSSRLSPHAQSLPYAQFGIHRNLPTRPTFKARKGTTTDSSAHLQKQGLGMYIAQYQTLASSTSPNAKHAHTQEKLTVFCICNIQMSRTNVWIWTLPLSPKYAKVVTKRASDTQIWHLCNKCGNVLGRMCIL